MSCRDETGLLQECVFFFSSRRRHTRFDCDWSSDVCSSDLLSILIIVNIYKLLITMNIGATYAFIVSLAYAIASPVYLYSHLTFIEPVGALICLYVLRKIFQKERTLTEVTVSSILLGILPWIHIRFAYFEVVLFFALLYRIYEQNRLKQFKFYTSLLLPVTILFIAYE